MPETNNETVAQTNERPPRRSLKKMLKDEKTKMPKDHTMRRILGYVLSHYKIPFIVVVVCIIITALVSSMSSIVITTLTNNYIVPAIEGRGNLDGLPGFLIVVSAMFMCAVFTSATYNIIMAKVGQGTLKYIRQDMFKKMQSLPISYFDTHQSGDIMSLYTNDVDTLRQFICQTMPQLVYSALIILSTLCLMIYYSLYLLIIVVLGVVAMLLVTKHVAGASTRYFTVQQNALGRVNGYIEEAMHGQKVIKVFCHEPEAKEDFDKRNGDLCRAATSANTYANVLMPIMGNIGNILYVLIAIVGSILIATEVTNVGLIAAMNPADNGMIGITIGFLTMTKSFTQNIANISQQINFIAQANAGGRRIFAMMDTPPEEDNGYVELVNARRAPDGTLVECEERTGLYAWKHPHKAEGTITYTELKGDIEMHDVDFAYVPGKTVLHDITLYAKPGQKVAFVGATGAGKTTITNLINRFYDIEDGKIRYDGININKIKKPDLRRSLGMVLQETNLFTGTIRENIRYGNLEATDEEVEAAAKLANAHDFIMRLPEGYDTMLESDGANLSQGQRQLISIARTACRNAPVLILDEATSSIDTRTESIVQRGMDRLMEGRTVFVIAHRLSTVQNSDVIMVLDHGRIIERGTHEQLIEKRGTYYSLYTGAFELE